MCHDVIELVQEMDFDNVEIQMAVQCAPLFAKLKLSNMLIVSEGEEETVQQILRFSDIKVELISRYAGKVTLLLYREEEMIAYLAQRKVQNLLCFLGYHDFTLEELFQKFRQRYQEYQWSGAAFPHEMGIFLGYPVEDVTGFIKHEGRNYLYTGYWKVYQNLQEKLQLFQRFEKAEKILLQFVAAGGSCGNIMKGWSVE